MRENQIECIFERIIFLKISSILISASSWLLEPCHLKTSLRLLFVPDLKSAEKLLHEHELEISYDVGKGESKVRGAPQINSGYEREC